MKNYNVVFSKGHLVDQDTGKRVLLKHGAKFAILGDDGSFEEQDPLMHKPSILNSEEKERQVKNKLGNIAHVKIADAGQKLAFKVGLTTRTKEDKKRVYWFIAELLEDLYLFENKGGDFNLFDSHCKTEVCAEGDLMMYEIIYAKSLSSLFANTVAFYFPLQRSGATNAFKTFYFTNQIHDSRTTFHSEKNLLERFREKAIELRKAEKEAVDLLKLQELSKSLKKDLEKLDL